MLSPSSLFQYIAVGTKGVRPELAIAGRAATEFYWDVWRSRDSSIIVHLKQMVNFLKFYGPVGEWLPFSLDE